MNSMKKLVWSAMAALALSMTSNAYAGYISADGYVGATATYNFRSTAGLVGVELDDKNLTFTLPFAFTFFGKQFTSGSNGWISGNGLLGLDIHNMDEPDKDDPDDERDAYCCNATYHQFSPTQTVVAGWFDMFGIVYTQTKGTAGNQEFIVTWESNEYDRNAPPPFLGAANRFQAILHEGSNSIEFQYAELNSLLHFASVGGIKGGELTKGMNYRDFESGVTLAELGLLITYQPLTAETPEPGTVLLSGSAFAAIALARRRSRRAGKR